VTTAISAGRVDARQRYAAVAWARFFARNIDLSLISGIVFCLPLLLWLALDRLQLEHAGLDGVFRAALEGLTDPDGQGDAMKLTSLWIVAGAALESFCIGLWGRTPGKALMGLRVVGADGERVGVLRALRRLGLIVVFGYGLVIVAFFAHIAAYRAVAETGAAKWDTRLGLATQAQPLPFWRWAVGLAAVIAAVFAPDLIYRLVAR
jgi:uncharacterized RDD family membrane protein YckC